MKLIPPSGAPDTSWAGQVVDALAKTRISELSHGVGTITWPGGAVASNTIQVKHNLSGQATALGGVFVQVNALSLAGVNMPALAGIAAGASAQEFQIAFWTIDGQLPVLGSSLQFYWMAML